MCINAEFKQIIMDKITEKECRRQIFFCLNRNCREKQHVYLTEWVAQICVSLREHPERSEYYRRALNRIMKELGIFDYLSKPDEDIIDGIINFIMAKPIVAALIMKHSADLNSYLKPTEDEKEEAKDCI